jgi:putative PEP-CTERM system histidine kinase
MNHYAILALIAAIISGLMALGVAVRARRSVSHWSFVLGFLVIAAERFFAYKGFNAADAEIALRWDTCGMIANSFVPGLWLLFSLTYARGNSQEFLARWRKFVIAAFVLPVGVALIYNHNLVALPANVAKGINLTTAGVALKLFLLVGSVVILMNLERTFRVSVGTMRWRIKFMMIGLGVLFLARAYTSSQEFLFYHVDPALDGLLSGAVCLACPLILRSLMRSGHFEVNVYPSHSIIHNSLILMLAGVYLFILGVFANLVRLFGADGSFILKAFILLVGLVGLTIILMSERVRLATKRFVSRNFQRPMYDYRTVWRRFTECTASRMDQTELCRDTAKLVAEIFQVLSVTIWLVDEKKENLVFAASTSLTDAQGVKLSPSPADAAEVLRALQNHPEPVDIDSSREKWAVALRRCHPDEFREGGSRICVSMMVGGEVLGLLTLGDRVAGAQFLHQDLDLLKCVGDQVAASLRNLQLSGKLLQVKEMEAFQAMSAFFVHDLKNTASTLSLMLKNLPVHFNDPAFREDALRGVGKTVTHINHLITRLSLLRHGLEVRRTEADLNDVVTRSLAAQNGALEVELIKDLQPLPKISIDPEQVAKVITNLVLNAVEAVPKTQGQVRVGTSRVGNWAALSVSDNGCGMSPEFLNRSLFRPFQTTKKTGLGIGMFQSKMVIEAHGGRIEVESQPNAGTTFRVLLPITTK